MTEDAWIAYRSAAVELGGDGPVLRALVTGKIKSQGWRYGRTEPDDLTSDHWAAMTFLPTFKGPLSEKMRGLDWLVPRGTELRRVCLGFGEIRLSRADVERLARSDGHKARSEGETDLPAKELKVGAAAEILKRLFPTGRKHHKREELKAIVERELGYEISLETLKRAMRDAWGVAQTGSK